MFFFIRFHENLENHGIHENLYKKLLDLATLTHMHYTFINDLESKLFRCSLCNYVTLRFFF
jgi:hypothetical protein